MAKKNNSSAKLIKYLILFVYSILLIWVILFKMDLSLTALLRVKPIITKEMFARIQYIPFKTILSYSNFNSSNILYFMENFLGNIILFIPLGFLLCTTITKKSKFKYVFIISLLTSLCFETIQFIFSIGSCDIDDLILNTLGGIVGFFIFKAIISLSTKAQSLTCFILSVIASLSLAILRGMSFNLLAHDIKYLVECSVFIIILSIIIYIPFRWLIKNSNK